MGYLLDTHSFIWLATDPDRIPDSTLIRLTDKYALVMVSVASVWEIAIKSSLGKLSFDVPVEKFIERSCRQTNSVFLGIDPKHALRTATLPLHHRDPFDRLLVGQCLEEGLTLVSCDARMDDYGVHRIWQPPTVH